MLFKPIYAEWTLLPQLFGPVHLQFNGCLSVFITTMFIEMSVINANSVDPDQSPRSVALIWVYTVCQCPIYGTLGINGLRVHTDKCFVYYINFYSEEMFIFKFPYKYSEYYTLFLHLD